MTRGASRKPKKVGYSASLFRHGSFLYSYIIYNSNKPTLVTTIKSIYSIVPGLQFSVLSKVAKPGMVPLLP